MIQSGRYLDLLILLVISSLVVYFIQRARQGKIYPIRRLAAVDAIEDVVGRAVELNRPVHCSPGDYAMITGMYAVMTLAGLSVIGYVSRMCARYGAKMYVTFTFPELIPLVQDIVREAYVAEGKPEEYNQDEQVVFFAGQQQAYCAALMGKWSREPPAANIFIGTLAGATYLVFEAAARSGAIQISGTGRLVQIPMCAALTDYFLIVEELYAAGAMLSEEPRLLGSISAQDAGKYIALALIILGLILTTGGVTIVQNILTL